MSEVKDPLLAEPGEPGVNSCDVNVLIATPCYGGVSHVSYNQSIRWLMATFQKFGIRHQVLEIATESLIPRARNSFANIVCFDKDPYGNDYTDLLFVDADIAFHPDNVIQMIGYDKPICGLPYPCKDVDWEKIDRAVKKNVPVPLLPRMGSRPIVNTNGQSIQFSTEHPVKFPQIGTGCIMIKRYVLQKFAEDQNRRYKLMQGEQKFGDRTFAYDFFQIGINPDTGYYDSEDYRFCLDAAKLGFDGWILPWAVTTHTGNMTFTLDIRTQAGYGITDDRGMDTGFAPKTELPSAQDLDRIAEEDSVRAATLSPV